MEEQLENVIDTKAIIELLTEKAHANNDCISSDDILEFVDIDSEEYDIIEDELEESGIIISFSKEDEEIAKVEEVQVESYTELVKEFKSNDLVRQYLYEIGNVPLLTKEEEIKYSKMVFEGRIAKRQLEKIDSDDANTVPLDVYQSLLDTIDTYDMAREKLINSNLRLVVSIAKKYAIKTAGMHILDLIQEGNMGLMRTIDKFDYRKGYNFSTYATWWIKQSITRAIGDQSRTIRLPIHIVEKKNQYIRAKRALTQENGRAPSAEELAEALGITVRKLQELETYGSDTLSLDANVNSEDNDSTLEDFIPDRESLTPEGYTIKVKLHNEIQAALSKLPEREAKIVALRFGLEDGQPKTLEEVGKMFGLTRERIRQIEVKALRRLKKPNYSSGLRDFINYI